MRLSIIIPYFNTQGMTDELLSVLVPQMNDETEIILVDDGSNNRYNYLDNFCGTLNFKYIRKRIQSSLCY